MKTQDIRKRFLDYFKQKNHAIIASSPVIPHNDPTLLFTNAGMNQFKDVFLMKSAREYTRAATAQKCVRVGGKHNDLENVGHTQRHLTFFEMLGNFSFGDYFKEAAIQYAWEVSTEIFGFDKEKLYPTVFQEDEEAFQLWQKYVPASRITRMTEKDNFWAMGDTGPCGPCSELYYDKGQEFSTARNPAEDEQGIRFLEFWNLVFMQYNKRPDGIQENLPKPSIDTGAGLERVMSLIQKKESVFETDLLRNIIAAIEKESKVSYDLHDDKKAPAFRVIADHLRCLSFAIADGVIPSNIERGYVLRKVLRRAVRYGRTLGFDEPFLAKLLPSLIQEMGQDYKELIIAEKRISEIMTQEEEAFLKTLRRGGNILNQIIESSSTKHIISGEDAFKLKDTYGLPLEEIQLIAKDAGLSVDHDSYAKLEKEAKERSKTAQKTTHQLVEDNLYKTFIEKNGTCLFMRKEQEDHSSEVIGIIKDGAFAEKLIGGEEGILILRETPFYPEMGGQVGDSGELFGLTGKFTVLDTISPYKGVITHIGTLVDGVVSVGDTMTARINWERRQNIANNHTATHLLHWALHRTLGESARQAGSVVDAEHLRFDFSHHKQVTVEEIREIERLVNAKIRENVPVSVYELPYEDAQKREDIKQFFGEKYGTVVRVIDIDFSKELCGGTHTSRTGNIGYFRILKEGSIAAGTRRIEAVTGEAAEKLAYEAEDELKGIAEILKTPQQKIKERIEKLHEELKHLHNEIKTIRRGNTEQLAQSLLPFKTSEKGINYIAALLTVQPGDLKEIAEIIQEKCPTCIVALACSAAEKAHVLVKVSPDLVKKGHNANTLIKAALQAVEGAGGGRPEMAQGAGKSPLKLNEAINAVVNQL